MYYPTVVQSTPAGMWPNTYQIGTQQQQAIPAVYYQVPEVIAQQQQPVPTVYYQVPEVIAQQQQPVPTVYYQAPSVTVPPVPTTTSSEVIVQQPQTTSTTTTKTTTTRILDPTTLPTVGDNSVIEATKTTTTITNPVIPATQTIVTSSTAAVPQVTTTTVAPTVEMTTIQERPRNRLRGLRSLSPSTSSDDTTTSTNSTVTPQPEITKQQTVLPPQVPIQTTTIAPVRRIIHRAHHPRTPSGYYSSDLDYGRRKVYKTDYKYRHYYCCNWCKGRCDLSNRSYGCCEWFYGCPVWALILSGLFFLALLVTFFTLFGLQPSINSTRRTDTAETRLLNRTQIIYGFYQNCGYQINATSGTPTTLILCTNTATTTTAQIELSPFYTVISGTNYYSYSKILILFCYLFVLKISKININA